MDRMNDNHFTPSGLGDFSHIIFYNHCIPSGLQDVWP